MSDKNKENKDAAKAVDRPCAGVPEAEFLSDIDSYMEASNINGNVDLVLGSLDEQFKKYKRLESTLIVKKRRLEIKIPELQRSADMVVKLKKCSKAEDEFTVDFLLSDQVYMESAMPPTDKVYLWLGANVMLEYSLEEALEVINNSMDTAKKNLELADRDLNFLRDQLTTTEVNMARVFNWSVRKRQAAKATFAA